MADWYELQDIKAEMDKPGMEREELDRAERQQELKEQDDD